MSDGKVWFGTLISFLSMHLFCGLQLRINCAHRINCKNGTPNNAYECSLCKNELDSHNHLFFECEYAKEIWGKLRNKAKIHDNEDTWERIVNKLSSDGESRSVWEIIKKTLSCSCSVPNLARKKW